MSTRPIRRAGGIALLAAWCLAPQAPPATAQGPSIYDRKVDARAVIQGSNGLYDGAFVSQGTAMLCGEVPKEASITGTAMFLVEFPLTITAGHQITSIAFGSSQLVERNTSATAFRLSVSVVAQNGGRPYAYVLNTEAASNKNVGTATLTRAPRGAVMLTVVGQNERGERIDFSITCA